ncbi:YlxR family protein [Paludicola sp. MB14-C6]|uniref:RNase P modulator RnpM n=1 Tax=Paludihabitans sp. MB14-C6 TaxID=3070656 RepID=UPI0027DB6CC9|nr:YlxR family protein [Paludicola sp. MB14-C6]WMJ23008.1 YlxR family protein [Paludicola sp. MB14-C6]
MQTRKVPLRKCTGCNEMKPKKELVRVVKNKENEIFLDLTGKKAGRGAYVCCSLDCLKKARKQRGFERAFSCKIPDEVYDQMEKELAENE